MGLDTVCFKNIKQYLLYHLSKDLGINKMEFDDDENEWYSDSVKDDYLKECYFTYKPKEMEIPFWKDIINEFNKRYY